MKQYGNAARFSHGIQYPEDFTVDNTIALSPDAGLHKKNPALADDEKIDKISYHFKEIMVQLGLDLADESLKETPMRVAKMYVKELFSGLNPATKPSITLFENSYNYNQMLVEKNIGFYSTCEHHFVPIIGKVHIAYISSGKIIGLSKINRIVQYFAKRPQVQERLTMQIAGELKKILDTQDLAIVIEATHFCLGARGVRDDGCSTFTSRYDGRFKTEDTKSEFLAYIKG